MNKILFDTIQIIRNESNEYINEASITSLVNGILYSYGWNVFDPYEVAPQYNILTEAHPKRVDLAIKLFGQREILIEIKDIKKGKNLKKNEKQLKDYLKKTPDVNLGILTNSASWWFYNSNKDENNIIVISRQDKLNILKDDDAFIEKIFSRYLSKEKMAEKWFQRNVNIINSNNSQKLSAIINLRNMKDKRIYEPLNKIFNEDKEDYPRISALNGIFELHKLGKLDNEIIYPILKKAMNDQSSYIKKQAMRYLNEIQEENNKKIQKYKSDYGIQ